MSVLSVYDQISIIVFFNNKASLQNLVDWIFPHKLQHRLDNHAVKYSRVLIIVDFSMTNIDNKI